MNILIVFGTTEGHTLHLCEYIRDFLREAGDAVTLVEASRAPGPDRFDVCFLAGSLHVGGYQAELVDYVRARQNELASKPAAFLSVSLSAAGASPSDWDGLQECVAKFEHATHWRPTEVHHVAGAIRYSRYDFFRRLALKYIAGKRGLETVASRDYDLTDYYELKDFVLRFAADYRR